MKKNIELRVRKIVNIAFIFIIALPFIRNAHVLLYPLTGLFFVYILSIIVQWNFTQMIVTFYEYRVGHKRLP
jgi:hypothetical protein